MNLRLKLYLLITNYPNVNYPHGIHVMDGCLSSQLSPFPVNPTFSALVTAVRAAGLVERLSGPDPVTIFAPTNAAFDLLPPAKLQVVELSRVVFSLVNEHSRSVTGPIKTLC